MNQSTNVVQLYNRSVHSMAYVSDAQSEDLIINRQKLIEQLG